MPVIQQQLRVQVIEMVDLVIAVCEIAGPLAVIGIGLTLLAIAMGKINV
jgi:hypothetical protein